MLVGVLVYVLLMRRMTGESVLAAVLTTIALGILLRGRMCSPSARRPSIRCSSSAGSTRPFRVGASARISAAGLLLVLGTAVVYGGLFAFLRMTRWGIRMRAAGQNPLLAAQRGIRLHGVYALAWGLATFSGGMAGMLLALRCRGRGDACHDRPEGVSGGARRRPRQPAGCADRLARSSPLAEVPLISYVDPLLSDVVPFFVLLAMLVVRPWGLFGTREELDRV